MQPESPLSLPPRACNARCHVFGLRHCFPYPPDGTLVPSVDAPKEALVAPDERLGLQRCVVVQSGCHRRLWHLQIHGDPRLLTDMAASSKRSPVPVLLDHIGRIDASLGLHQPDFEALLALKRDERFWNATA